MVGDFEESPSPAVLRTEMEGGIPKQAQILSKVMITRPVVYKVNTLTDLQSFMTWFRGTIGRGALWFDWTDPIDSVVKQARIVGGVIKASPLDSSQPSKIWKITFSLEVWDS